MAGPTMPTDFARDRKTALRNKRIVGAYKRKRKPLTQAEIAEKYGLSQPRVSQILCNPNATKTREASA